MKTLNGWDIITLIIAGAFIVMMAGNVVRAALRPSVQRDVEEFVRTEKSIPHTTENFIVWSIAHKKLK